MMGFGNSAMMNGSWGIVGLIGFMFWIVLFFDAVLLGMWLWKHVQKR